MNGYYFKRFFTVVLALSASLLMFAGLPVQAADRYACDTQDTYRLGPPGKGVVRNLDCERVEFSAFERGLATEQAGYEEKGVIKVGKPGYNRRSRND